MTILEFMSNNPITSVFLFWLFCDAIVRTLKLILRAMNIRKNGWPPAHLDADGDFVKEKKYDFNI